MPQLYLKDQGTWYWVAVKELNLSYYNEGTMLIALYISMYLYIPSMVS